MLQLSKCKRAKTHSFESSRRDSSFFGVKFTLKRAIFTLKRVKITLKRVEITLKRVTNHSEKSELHFLEEPSLLKLSKE